MILYKNETEYQTLIGTNIEINSQVSHILETKMSKLSTQETTQGYNLAYDGWAEDFVVRINDTTKANVETFDNKNCLKWTAGAGSQEYDTKYIFKINWKENTQYRIKYDFYSLNGYYNLCIEYADGTIETLSNRVSANTWVSVNILTSANKTIKYIRAYWSSGINYMDLDTFMVSEGTTDYDYEPYTNGPSPNPNYPQEIKTLKTNISITITDGTNTNTETILLGTNEICGIGDYKDELIIDNNGHCWLNKKTGKVDLSTLNWSTYSTNKYRTNDLSNFIVKTPNWAASPSMCNKYISKPANFTIINGNFAIDNDGTIYIYDTTGTPSGNMYYQLLTSQLIDLNYDVDLTLFEGTNNISNSENMDMEISIYTYLLDLSKNGLGYLNNILSASITEELNGEYSLSFEYPMNDILSDEIKEGRIVKCKASDGTQQCFIIKNIDKTYDKISVKCTHLFYMLLDDFVDDLYPQNLSPKPFLDWLLTRANYQLPFTTTSDVSLQATGRYVRKNLVEIILGNEKNSMVNLFGIELKRNNWNIGLLSRLGADRGEKLIYGKNITGINLSIDTNEIYTRIMPVGFDGLLLPEKYIDAENINDYPYPKIGLFKFDDIKYDPEDEEAYHTLEEAYAALRNAVAELYQNGVSLPRINIKIDWLELSKTEEYKQYANLERVELGDTIHAEIFGINYTTRVIKTIYNPLTDRVEKFEVGTFQPNYATQMNKYEFELQQINPASILEDAQDNATSLITQAMGGYVYKTNSELYIMDTDNPSTATNVWRWNINGLGYSNTGINGPYGLAMTMDGQIVADFISTGTLRTSVIQGYDSLTTEVANNTGQISVLTQSVGAINTKIQDITDITTSAESPYAIINLVNVNASQPIMIKVHPTLNNISYLYPRDNLFPSDTLYMTNRLIQFKNTTTNEIFTYELFDDLLFYDEDHYDEFYFDYDTETVQITKRCKYNADGTVGLLAQEQYETTSFPTTEELYLTTGNYEVRLPGYNYGYIMVRALASNIYTAQFATTSELSQTASQLRTEVAGSYATKNELQVVNSSITETANQITSQVAQLYETKENAEDNYTSLSSTITQTAEGINTEVIKKVGKEEVISSINQSAESISISANKVNISGVITAINNDTSTTINGNKIKTGSITSNQVNSSIITTSNFSAQSVSASKITSGSLTSNNVKIGSWNINGTGILSSNARIYPNYLGYLNNDAWTSVNWAGVGRAGTAYSDKNLKKDIKSLDKRFNDFFDDLKPISFKWKSTKYKTDDKEHMGFIAQDIQASQKNNDLDLDLVFKTDDVLNLDKREIIALNTWQIQLLKKEIKELKQEIENLKKGQ